MRVPRKISSLALSPKQKELKMAALDSTVISSTADGQDMPTPPNSAPPPPASEMARHVGDWNRMDPAIYHQNVHVGSYTWSTADPRYKLLYYKALDANINPLVAHQAQTYTYFKGGMDIEHKLAGTAYQSGQVDLVVLPPHVHPKSLEGTPDYYVYLWEGIDAKQQGLSQITVRDVRQGAFHYINPVGNDQFSTQNIGGWLAIYVGIQLNTTSTGTQQISAQLWGKPSQDFAFAKLRMPSDADGRDQTTAPARIIAALDFHNPHSNMTKVCAGSLQPVTTMIVRRKTLKVSQVVPANHFDLNGKMWLEGIEQEASRFSASEFTVTTMADGGERLTGEARLVSTLNIHNKFHDVYISGKKGGQTATALFHKCEMDINWSNGIGTYTLPREKAGDHSDITDWQDKRLFILINPLNAVEHNYGGRGPVIPANESWFHFGGYEGKGWSYQPYEIAAAFSSKEYTTWIPKGTCAEFSLFDTTESLTLRNIKLWEEGYFTTNPADNDIIYDAKKFRLIFRGFIPRTTPPSSTRKMRKAEQLYLLSTLGDSLHSSKAQE